MCWNKDVSLNTFLFSGFVLLLIYYNNTYTKYKVAEFDRIWVYVFFSSFILMQLIEYFVWKNINNAFYNSFYSVLAVLLILFQPIASLTFIVLQMTQVSFQYDKCILLIFYDHAVVIKYQVIPIKSIGFYWYYKG